MHIAFHIGAHCTDNERLLKSLLRNRDRLADVGTAVPGPSKYRRTLRDVVVGLRGEPATLEAQDVLLETILDGDDPQRLVLSNPSFVSVPAKAVDEGRLYPRMAKAEWLRNLFPNHDVSFYMSVRDPATFVPALYAARGESGPNFLDFMAEFDPLALRWSDPIETLSRTCPDCDITIWCHEDSLMIWEEIMRAITGADSHVKLHGGFDLARTILSQDGMKRLRAYTAENPPKTPRLRRRILTAFVEKFGIEEAMVEDIDLPGWTSDLMAQLTAQYEADLARITQLPNVRTIAPD